MSELENNEGSSIESNKKCIAYLDLLGFTKLVENDVDKAHNMLIDSNSIFNDLYQDYLENIGYDDFKFLKAFETFIPFSDSLLIVGSNANDFIKAISHFLIHLILKTKDGKYGAIYTENALKGEPINIQTVKRKTVLYRGGITYGNIYQLSQRFTKYQDKIIDEFEFPNIYGHGYIKAVMLEGSGKGNNLFVDNSFISKLDDSNRKFIANTATSNEKIFLWPAYLACWNSANESNSKLSENWDKSNGDNNPPADMKHFLEHAVKLYIENFDQKQDYKIHYEEFLKTTIKAYYAGAERYYPKEKDKLKERIKEVFNKKLCTNYFCTFLDSYYELSNDC